MAVDLAAAGVNAVGSVISGYYADKAAKRAARAGIKMQQAGIDNQNQVTDRVEDMFGTYMQTGDQANRMLANATGLSGQQGYQEAMDAFRADPGYQWQQDEGMRAVKRMYAPQGGSVGGSALAALQTQGQGQANAQYGSWIDRLNGMSGQGMQGAGAVANTAVGAANNISQHYGNIGDARMGAAISTGQQITNAMTGIGEAAGNYAGSQRVPPVQQPNQQPMQQGPMQIQPAGGSQPGNIYAQNQVPGINPQANYAY